MTLDEQLAAICARRDALLGFRRADNAPLGHIMDTTDDIDRLLAALELAIKQRDENSYNSWSGENAARLEIEEFNAKIARILSGESK